MIKLGRWGMLNCTCHLVFYRSVGFAGVWVWLDMVIWFPESEHWTLLVHGEYASVPTGKSGRRFAKRSLMSCSVAFSQFFCSRVPDYRKMAVVEAHAWQTSVTLTPKLYTPAWTAPRNPYPQCKNPTLTGTTFGPLPLLAQINKKGYPLMFKSGLLRQLGPWSWGAHLDPNPHYTIIWVGCLSISLIPR